MHRRRVAALLAFAIGAALPAGADAKPRRKRAAAPRAAAHATEQTQRAISELMGPFKWEMTPVQVIDLITKEIEARYVEPIKQASGDVYRQDQLRKQMREEIDQIRKSYVKFAGTKTGWDVSIVDQDFVHKNSESMLVLWEKDQRRFFFFADQKLWKMFIAFNAELFQGKTFDQFAEIIQRRYGPAETKFRTTAKGDATLDHLEWPASGTEVLHAIDQTTFYGNYCLRLMDARVLAWIEERRTRNNPTAPRRDMVVEAATRESTMSGDPNADVVDRLTGRRPRGAPGAPAPTTTVAPPLGTPAEQEGAPPKKKKGGKDDPFRGMDL